ncbi:MAG TPA: hypothetical protein VGM98_15625 [Schlesneria sp.]|jgi:hypothetical protein
MNELKWKTATIPIPMLEYLRGKSESDRFRRFAIACCRRIWQHLPDDCRHVVEVAERFAEGLACDAERLKAHAVANSLCIYVDDTSSASDRFSNYIAESALCCLFDDQTSIPTYPTTCAIAAANAATEVVGAYAELTAPSDADSAFSKACLQEQAAQTDLVRTIWPESFKPC